MSSRAVRSSIAIISVIHGAVRVLQTEKRFARVDMQEALKKLNKECAKVRDEWCNNYGEKDIAWTLSKLNAWGTMLHTLNLSDELHTTVLVKIAIMSGDDLLSKIKNKKRIQALTNIMNQLKEFDNFIDPDGAAFISLSQADTILQNLYNLIGFSM